MATKVLDIDVANVPDVVVGLEGYHRLMVLVRIDGVPVDRVYMPVSQHTIVGSDLRAAIVQQAGRTFWQAWLRKVVSAPASPDRCSPAPAATIAICTRDRPDDLRRCLEVLTRVCEDGQEIVVVDSASTASTTREVVETFPGVRYLREDRPGLNRARNRALRDATHDIVAFIDDDAIPDPGWIRALAENFLYLHTACVTGLTMPVELETPAQETFETYATFARGFEHKIYNWSVLHPIAAGRVGAGTNMALRRSVVNRIGSFDEALDAGTPTCSGGETEMFARLLSRGYQIVYEPRAVNWHRHRRTHDELRQAVYGYGVGVYAFWTRQCLVEKEWRAAWVGLHWLVFGQIPTLLRAIFRSKGAPPADLIGLEVLGSFRGPAAYLRSRRQRRREA